MAHGPLVLHVTIEWLLRSFFSSVTVAMAAALEVTPIGMEFFLREVTGKSRLYPNTEIFILRKSI